MSYQFERAIFQSLKIPRNPTNISAEEFIDIISAITFLGSLSETITECRHKNITLPHHLVGLDDLWKARLFEWMKFLYNNYHTPASDSNSPSRWEAISYVACVFTYSIEENMELVASTPGTVELAVRLWTDTDYGYERSPYSLYHGWWGPFLLWNNHIVGDIGFMQKACEVEGVTKRFIFNLTLKRVKACVNPEECSSEQYFCLMAVATHRELRPVSIGIPVTRVIRAFMSATKGLMSYLKNPEKDSDKSILMTCLHYIHFLEPTLDMAQSIETVCEAIHQGIISIIVDFSAFFSTVVETSGYPEGSAKSMIDRIISIITTTIPQYMMYESVLMTLRDAGVEEIGDEHTPQTLAAELAKFKRIFRNSFMLLLRGMTYIAFCDSPKHHMSWTCNPSTIFQCSACGEVWYCTERCQREHWKDVHRDECKARNLKDDPTHEVIRKRDQRCVLHFTIAALKYSWEDIKKLSRNAGKPLKELTISFNYTYYPPEIAVFPRDCSAQIAGRYIHNSTIIECVVPAGHFYTEVITAAGYIDDSGDATGTMWTTGKSYIKYVEY